MPFAAAFTILTLLAASPFWLSAILPMQDYPQFLTFVRAFSDCHDPASPFFGAYTTDFALSPLVLPLVLARSLAALVGIEQAGRILWTAYAIALPLTTLDLCRVAGSPRATAFFVFPLVLCYWVTGGFFAFATGAPLLLFGLACTLRWFAAPTGARAAALALVACALHLWHGYLFAQFVLDVGALWLLFRFAGRRARVRALSPLLPAALLFVAWSRAVAGRPHAHVVLRYASFGESCARFFEFIAPILPGAAVGVGLFALLGVASTLAAPRARDDARFVVRNPFAWLAALSLALYFILPRDGFSTEGLDNRQPWLAALLFVPAARLPAPGAARRAVIAFTVAASACALLFIGRRFAAFDAESAGASRLIDRIPDRATLLAPVGTGATRSFPGRPLIAVEQYATIRHGGLPPSSFAGYGMSFIRYVGDHNPMPGLPSRWLDNPLLRRYDYVLLRSPLAALAQTRHAVVRPIARDGDWMLFATCGGHALPDCTGTPAPQANP